MHLYSRWVPNLDAIWTKTSGFANWMRVWIGLRTGQSNHSTTIHLPLWWPTIWGEEFWKVEEFWEGVIILGVAAVDDSNREVCELRECSWREIEAGAGAAGAIIHHLHRHRVSIVRESVIVSATRSTVIQVGADGTHQVTGDVGFSTRANCTLIATIHTSWTC